jgi:hypothetical protein
MLPEAQLKARRKPAKRRVLFAGLLADARELGVNRNHLYLVLSGRRQSARLLTEYHKLKSRQRKTKARAA